MEKDNIFLPVSEINAIRREIAQLTADIQNTEIQPNKFSFTPKKRENSDKEETYYVTVKTAPQIKWVREAWKKEEKLVHGN